MDISLDTAEPPVFVYDISLVQSLQPFGYIKHKLFEPIWIFVELVAGEVVKVVAANLPHNAHPCYYPLLGYVYISYILHVLMVYLPVFQTSIH